jgi:hypothetical protein
VRTETRIRQGCLICVNSVIHEWNSISDVDEHYIEVRALLMRHLVAALCSPSSNYRQGDVAMLWGGQAKSPWEMGIGIDEVFRRWSEVMIHRENLYKSLCQMSG